MAEYSWYNPFTWDMQNNPAYRSGQSYYDLTQGENAPPVNEDPLQLARDIGPIYSNAWETRGKPPIENWGATLAQDVGNAGWANTITDRLTNIETPVPDAVRYGSGMYPYIPRGTTIGEVFKGWENIGEGFADEEVMSTNPIYQWGYRKGEQGTNNEWDIADESESQLKGLRLKDMHNIPAARNFYQRNLGTQPFPHAGFEEMEFDETVQAPEKTGFNWSNLLPGGIMQAIGNKFKRSPQKQAEFEAYEASKNEGGWGDFGDYKGNIYRDPGTNLNRINIVDPTTGVTLLRNKNFDSMFGSDSVEEMIAKKDAWIQDRIAKNKSISKAFEKYAKSKGFYSQPKGDQVTTGGGQRDTSGWDSPGYSTRGGFTGKADPTSGGVRGHHGNFYQGGYMRRGYSRGGRVGILSVF